MNIQLSSRSDLWYTPISIMNKVRSVLGFIELDPASDHNANDIVGAGKIFTKEDEGLAQDWSGHKTIFLNPPGGKIGNQSKSILFWQRLTQHRNEFDHAIYMGFSVEQLATSQGKNLPCMLDFPCCIPQKRIKFISPTEKKTQPSHSNVIVYVPGRIDRREDFETVFSELGKVINMEVIL